MEQATEVPSPEQHKQRVSGVFDGVASGYDNQALRFFPFCADRVVDWLRPQRGWKVLDVATGTGALAIALAQAVGEQGQVTGIDLSQGMLARAEHNIKKLALENVDLLQMDAEAPEFGSDYFHLTTCSFGLFFLPDMAKALRQWRRVTRPGGRVLFTTFTENAFQPLLGLLMEDLAAAGLEAATKPLASERLKEADTCHQLMREAGFEAVEQNTTQVGYHLKDAQEWWEVIWNSAMRGLVEQLPPETQGMFRQRHLARAEERQGEDGLWLDVEVRLTVGTVPDAT